MELGFLKELRRKNKAFIEPRHFNTSFKRYFFFEKYWIYTNAIINILFFKYSIWNSTILDIVYSCKVNFFISYFFVTQIIIKNRQKPNLKRRNFLEKFFGRVDYTIVAHSPKTITNMFFSLELFYWDPSGAFWWIKSYSVTKPWNNVTFTDSYQDSKDTHAWFCGNSWRN